MLIIFNFQNVENILLVVPMIRQSNSGIYKLWNLNKILKDIQIMLIIFNFQNVENILLVVLMIRHSNSGI